MPLIPSNPTPAHPGKCGFYTSDSAIYERQNIVKREGMEGVDHRNIRIGIDFDSPL